MLTSPPSRGRGLKLDHSQRGGIATLSPPSRGRGLKLDARDELPQRLGVAPFTGAWIETSCRRRSHFRRGTSPPSRGRGLKPSCRPWSTSPRGSPPSRGRGLKLRLPLGCSGRRRSPPSRGRGLKPVRVAARKAARSQRVAPFTGAWIETCSADGTHEILIVAPFTGAWIETRPTSPRLRCWCRRPLHGGVD